MIEIIKSSVTLEKTDCIVNAAHEALQGGGGVDGAIHRAAGSSLLTECRSLPYVEPGIRCRVGEAVITKGHNLMAKFIIHTVAPRFVGSVHKFALMEDLYKNAKPGTEVDLKNCYVNCLKLAQANGLRSIAFPSLGTGGHSWPVQLAAPIALNAFKEYEDKFDIIKLNVFSDEDYTLYTNEAKKVWTNYE